MAETDHDTLIARDLGNKLATDMSELIERAMSLTTTDRQVLHICMSGASTGLGWALAALNKAHPGMSPESLADELWRLLRPMAIRGAAEGIQRGQTIRAQYR